MTQELVALLSLMSVYAAWIILPMMPAIIIYRLFPDTKIAAQGLLANLTVRTSGAFAAYLILFALSINPVTKILDTAAGFSKPVWTLKAKIELEDANGQQVQSADILKRTIVQTAPDPFTISSNLLRIQLPEGNGDFPLIIIEVPKFGNSVIDLRRDDEQVAFDYYNKTIEIINPIKIKQIVGTGFGIAAPPSSSAAGK